MSYKTIILDKGEAIIESRKCVNSNHPARFLASDNEECCQCSWGDCKVEVFISYNGHNHRKHILSEKEINELPSKSPYKEIPQFEGVS